MRSWGFAVADYTLPLLGLLLNHAAQHLDERAVRVRVVPSEVPQVAGESLLHGS